MAREIKSAVLHEKFGEHSTLIIVDENYNIYTLTGGDDTFHFLLQGVDLPNFSHRRVSGGQVYEANRRGYGGYYQGSREALDLIKECRERQKAPTVATAGFPLEVWCEDKYDFTDCTGYEDKEFYATDYSWLEVGKLYAAAYWRDDHSIAKGCYRIKTADGEEYEAPEGYFRQLRRVGRLDSPAA